jgi:hypothetical protein
MNRLEELKALVASVEADFGKFYEKGNKAAGTRVRNALLEIKKLADTTRKEISAITKEREEAKA